MNVSHNGHEHEFEPEYGLPEKLPPRERIVWQGSPETSLVFRHVFHARGLLAYFLLILVLRGLHQFSLEGSWIQAVAAASWLAPLFGLAMLLFWALSWLVAKTTVYTVTDRRVVMRVGIVLSLTFNIPLSRLQAADVRQLGHTGAGEIALKLLPQDKIAYVHLWPHARPWRFGHPEPMLRALPAIDGVSNLLRQVWALAHGQQPTQAVSETPYGVGPTPQESVRPSKAQRGGGLSGMKAA